MRRLDISAYMLYSTADYGEVPKRLKGMDC